MGDQRSLRKNVSMNFKLNGLSLKGDACDFLVNQLLPIDDKERDSWLLNITEFICKNKLDSSVIEKSHLINALQECCKAQVDTSDETINVISAFEIPHFYYNAETKRFLRNLYQDRISLFDSAISRTNLFQKRYINLKQRISRHQLLSSSDSTTSVDDSIRVKLRPIDYFLSSSDEDNAVILGILSQLKEGKYYLEDPTGFIPLDISQAVFHSGIFTESCILLAEGVCHDGTFYVEGIALPPIETSDISRNYFGNENTFGGTLQTSGKLSVRLQKIERENEEAMIVFICDIWLDQVKVVEKLNELLSGYNEYSPTVIVLMGNFISTPQGSKHSQLLREKFIQLADIICKYPSLVEETLFVIIPGPLDSPYANILPRPPLPDFITREFLKKIPKCIFGTNPCRIQYCTQEIVILREDVLTKMSRNCIRFPQTNDISLHLVKTILSQCHLVPLSLSVCPVYWSHDDALSLYPLPDVIVIADQMNEFTVDYKQCIVFNPSSFSKRQYCFSVYIPASKQVEESQIPDNT